MPCIGCEKECKCTADKCAENCKCSEVNKCGCRSDKVSNGKDRAGGGCCKKPGDAAECKDKESCCGKK